YASADVRGGVDFVTILGPNLPSATTINELTTVAAGFSMAQFYKTGVISGNSFGLQIAADEPSLLRIPDAWTVTVKVNDSGNDHFLFAGLGNLVFDSGGAAWIPNNVRKGRTASGRFMMVLQPNGRPADGTNGTPVSPIMGGG